ncbi:LysR family transcriptional regulator [Capsulimonas corticalis]|uniref:LysR family transcriptional regulator n=1 Tax=Capsulimonas corticalis TaxID=2219043 RepID=A0A402CPE0_9BACT|nr:LysR family transcriptional regulator [Capsulimonas corticalis]BDI33103.1 LysR family transcriptional regulator [Capsulimonas corticalis]
MELRQLEAFVKIASEKNFTRAAEELSLTQPAVTRQIAALEQELRTRLLDRLGRRVELTAAGAALYPYALEILRLADEARRAVGDVAQGVSGHLSVGASSTAATYLLPPLLRRFREEHPGVEMSVHTGASARVAEMVLANAVDMAVVMDFRERPGIASVTLAEYANVAVTYPDHALARQKEGIRVSQLAGIPLILMQTETSLRRQVDRLFMEAGVEKTVSMELDNVEAIKKMIEARLGVSILPLLAVHSEITDSRLAALTLQDAPAARQRLSAIYRVDKYRSAALQAFIQLLMRELEKNFLDREIEP